MQQPDCWWTSVRIWMTARGRRSTASRQNSRRFTVRSSLAIPPRKKNPQMFVRRQSVNDSPVRCTMSGFHPFLAPYLSCLQYFTSVCHYVCPSVHLSACLYSCLSVRPPIWLSVHLCTPAPGSGSVSAFPIPIRIQESKINACIIEIDRVTQIMGGGGGADSYK